MIMKELIDSSIAKLNLGIVCPMANEADLAMTFVKKTLGQCEGFASVTFFAVIDCASTDDTLDILLILAESESRLNVVWAPENRCVVDAYVRGYKEAIYAGCDWILEIDAGFSHQPSDIQKFFPKMLQGFDCVFGSRFCQGGSIKNSPLSRRLISRGGTIITNLLLGTKLTDMTSGFQMFTQQSLKYILSQGIKSRYHFFQTEIKFHCRQLKIAEAPIHYQAASPSVHRAAIHDAFKNLGRLFLERQFKGAKKLKIQSNNN
ncbi:glycosyltransferase [Coleofasciculus sp. E1-EBD-02]|uniref:glycosyltransferase n=1 Tax=Coleofasciculus sp. E1-EBD-02 TaxID=3068481 RepID=UPI0032FD8B0B